MQNSNYELDLKQTIRLCRLLQIAEVISMLIAVICLILGMRLNFAVGFFLFIGILFVWGVCLTVSRMLMSPLIRIKKDLYAMADDEGLESQILDENRVNELIHEAGLLGGVIWIVASRVHSGSKAKALNAEVALYALQSEINPHFLYNSLEVIRNFAMKYDITEISDMSMALARVFRYSISRPGEIATLADEINNVKNYVKIQQYRFPDRFDIIYDVDMADDSIVQCKLPVLTLQPIIENALNHGLEAMTYKGSITLRAAVSDRKLMITITDTGVGIDPVKLEELRQKLNSGFVSISELPSRHLRHKTGISLNNVNNRLKLYFGSEYGISLTSCIGQFTSVEIVVPKILAV